MCLFCWQKCGPRPKLFLRLDIFSTFRGVHTLIFTYVPYIVIGLHEEPANFYREKRSVAFVTGHLITFLMVLSLICLGITQILICENQTIWGLEILLRTIVAALLNTKCNDRFIKNKRYQETSKEYFTIVQMIIKKREVRKPIICWIHLLNCWWFAVNFRWRSSPILFRFCRLSLPWRTLVNRIVGDFNDIYCRSLKIAKRFSIANNCKKTNQIKRTWNKNRHEKKNEKQNSIEQRKTKF